jgi:hypothetical protein
MSSSVAVNSSQGQEGGVQQLGVVLAPWAAVLHWCCAVFGLVSLHHTR